ncbi:oxygen-independent coproporphyrinogen III oxidase [Brevundimonas sp.]|uniref:oxygen-independent coproporphyrinogen III oxidase n=1 Tax=Brevundimonas sp. TaxID=1871086 RepID=UPI0025F19E84|nr:oxygen-independent coproporphyrinogen III oxidase [Brevundimonas sp.]
MPEPSSSRPRRALPPAWAAHAERRLPRYTSYPPATGFRAIEPTALAALEAELERPRPDERLSAYVHVPFCRRLCWYCGCSTSVFHDYDRVESYLGWLRREVDLWAGRLGEHGGLSHLHFGGGSPNSLSAGDFRKLLQHVRCSLGIGQGAEVAIELDPTYCTESFAEACGVAGVSRASLGAQTFDPEVQARINRPQPYEVVQNAIASLRGAGVLRVNIDLMYGLPGQREESVEQSARQAAELRPDRIAVFGYAHVPWLKKHQRMIASNELPDTAARWTQAEVIDETLFAAGYVRIGMDHYAWPNDPLAVAASTGALRRNFQGYTDDGASTLLPLGPSAIGQVVTGMVQNAPALRRWREAVSKGNLPVQSWLEIGLQDRLRAAVIEQLMCSLNVDVGATALKFGLAPSTLDEGLAAARRLSENGLCKVFARRVVVPEGARRLVRVVAACFDGALEAAAPRFSPAI